MKQKNEGHLITAVEPGSIAEEVGIKPGDRLLMINDTVIEDVFDYRYFTEDEELTLTVYSAEEDEEWDIDIEKDADEELGLSFDSGLMDDYKHCCNKCIFCFIDQMPPGMRDTLYFKDDDARLSFLQGNYVTLTNMREKDIEKICFYKLSPINISIHTTNPELRCRMLSNKKAGSALKIIDRFCEAGLEINGQIVCCRGINDGAELERTLSDIERYLPNLKSLSVVPVGLTKYRDKLFKLESFDRESSLTVLGIIEKWQKYYEKKHGTKLVYASDEWYLCAGLPIPPQKDYEGFPQIENGVGMIRSFLDEFEDAFASADELHEGTVSVITGKAMEPIFNQLAKRIGERFPKTNVRVFGIRNDFFGEKITVAGLVTGRDIIAQLTSEELGDFALIPTCMLRAGESTLLDDLTVSDLEKALQTKMRIVKSSGAYFLDALRDDYVPVFEREVTYEQTDSGDSWQT